MSLIDQISEGIKSAMKAREKVRLETLRSIKKILLEKEVAVRPSGQTSLTPEQELEALVQLAKQRKDSIDQYQQVGREDMAAQEAAELAIIEEFLPKPLSEEEIAEVIEAIVVAVGASSAKDMGKVMGPAMQQLRGKADGQKVQALVKARLGN